MSKHLPFSVLRFRIAGVAVAWWLAITLHGSALAAVPAPTSPRSFAELRTAAEKGDMVAQRLLANAYLTGEGVPQDTAEAVRWLRLAAEQRDAAAQYVMGILYDEGRGVPRDLREAVKWYELAAQQGLPDAQFNLALCYSKGEGLPKDAKRAAEWLLKAAKNGDAQAQSRLGLAYITANGVERNPVEAASWLRKAAYPPAEDAKAQFFLGRLFQEGEGVERDVETAARWFRKAAAQGYSDAQFHLGRLLMTGEGGERNPPEGRSLLEKAAAQRHEAATQYLAQLGRDPQNPAANTRSTTESSPMTTAANRPMNPGGWTPAPAPASKAPTPTERPNSFSPPPSFGESFTNLSLSPGGREPLPAVPPLPAADAAARPLAPSKTPDATVGAKEPSLPPFTPEATAKGPAPAPPTQDFLTLPPTAKKAEPVGLFSEPPRTPPTQPEPTVRHDDSATTNRSGNVDSNSSLVAIAWSSTIVSALILFLGIYAVVTFKARLHGLESELKKAQFELSKANVNLSSMMHQVEQLSLMAPPSAAAKTSLPEWNAEAPKAHTASFKISRSK